MPEPGTRGLGSASLADRLKTALLFLLPQHAISRAVLWWTRRQSRFTQPVIRRFVDVFGVDMRDAEFSELEHYDTFNRFFTRALRKEARPIDTRDRTIVSPADGRVSAVGNISGASLFQAKGHDYSLDELLGGDQDAVTRLAEGSFITIYLSPRDYHRLHMPLSGRLLRQTHVPGRLHSVSPFTVRALPRVFARNERVVATFETGHGLMSLVLVGAINVAAIETVWHGLVTPPAGRSIAHIDFTPESAPTLERGQEMGRFNMGSTIIVLLEGRHHWAASLEAESAVRMGQMIGQIGPSS